MYLGLQKFFHLYSAWENGKMHFPFQFLCCQLKCEDVKISLFSGILLPLPLQFAIIWADCQSANLKDPHLRGLRADSGHVGGYRGERLQ